MVLIIPAGYVLVPYLILIPSLALMIIEMFAWFYIMFLKDWITRNITKKGKIRHGTYIDVSFWDLGFKTGNMPGMSIDEAFNYVSSSINNILSPDIKDEITKLLVKFKSQKEIEEILKTINNQEKRK